MLAVVVAVAAAVGRADTVEDAHAILLPPQASTPGPPVLAVAATGLLVEVAETAQGRRLGTEMGRRLGRKTDAQMTLLHLVAPTRPVTVAAVGAPEHAEVIWGVTVAAATAVTESARPLTAALALWLALSLPLLARALPWRLLPASCALAAAASGAKR